MAKINILLCCGAGFSSGLLAQQSRKAAKKSGMDCTVNAVSESQVSGYLDKIQVLLLGPHYANQLEHFTQMAAPYGIRVGVIRSETYGTLDGKALLEQAMSILESQ